LNGSQFIAEKPPSKTINRLLRSLKGHFVSILRKWSRHPLQLSWNFTQIVITPYDEHLQNLNEICQEMAW